MIHTDDLHCPNSAVSGLTAAGTTSSKLWIKWGPIPCNARQMSDLECVVNRDEYELFTRVEISLLSSRFKVIVFRNFFSRDYEV